MRKRWYSAILCVIILAGVCTAVFAAGGSEDPLISASWLYDTLIPRLRGVLDSESAEQKALAKEYEDRLGSISFPDTPVAEADTRLTPMELSDSDIVTLDAHSSFVLLNGTAKLRSGNSEVLDLTVGEVCADGTWLLPTHRYFAAVGGDASILCYSSGKAFLDGNARQAHNVPFPAADRFRDTEGHWAAESICRMTELGAVNGIDQYLFAPDAKVSRAMFITVLCRLFGAEEQQSFPSAFSDVKDGDWYAPYINWGAEKGLIIGYGNGTFGPDDLITREQMAAVLARCCTAFDFPLPESSETVGFSDREKISAWAKDAVELSRRAGLMEGRTTGEFDPAGYSSRAEMCTVFCRLYDQAD